MTVYLVPGRRGRYELYSEAPEIDPGDEPTPAASGRMRQWMESAGREWSALVERARHGGGATPLARWRDRIVCSLAESIAEQRTLWALRRLERAELVVPASLDAAVAQGVLRTELGAARGHHLRWLTVDALILVATGVLAVVPGPNVLAYYFLFRVAGHLQSWRGARQGMDRIAWTVRPDAALAELAALVDEPREARAARVEAIAERLNLPHLAAFFDRIALPST